MDNPSLSDSENRALNRVIRITPSRLREEHGQKWQSALKELPDKHQRRRLLRSMLRTAFRLRLADLGCYPLGGYGVIPAAAAWLIPLVSFMVIPIFSLFLAPIILAIMPAALFFAGSPTRLQHWIMAGSILIGLSAFAYFWWALGVMIDASDAMIPAPKSATFAGASLLVILASILAYLGAAIFSFRRNKLQES